MLESKIIKANIYREGAIVHRTVTFPLEQGQQRIEVLGLTETTDTASIRVFAPEGLSISDVQTEWLSEQASAEMTETLENEIAQLKTAQELIDFQIELWKKNGDFETKDTISVQDICTYLTNLPITIKALLDERSELEKKLKQLYKQLDEKQKLFKKPILKILVSTKTAKEYTLEFSYKEQNAYWTPVYEIHANADTDSLCLRLTGKVGQSTNENWNEVELHLFSGNPSVSGTIPILKSKYVTIYEPQPPVLRHSKGLARAMVAESSKASDAVCDEEVDLEPRRKEVRLERGSANKGETMMEYSLSGFWNIISQQEIVTHIEEKTLACEYHDIAIPELEPTAFLAARVKNSLLEDMHNTQASIYISGTFAGTAIVNIDFMHEHTDISLGIDDTIKIKKVQKRKYSSSQILKGVKKTEFEYELTTISKKAKPCLCTLKDRIPVSQDKNIQIENLKISDAKIDEKTGFIEWEYMLNPNETKTLTVAYTVSWPKDKEISYR
ncbi:MAG: DUF4139 domain-containing protein [Spirochaetaceae bacterium]|nr:DUF4139 domain-containing protein [Spirochaetaceae bacterium]